MLILLLKVLSFSISTAATSTSKKNIIRTITAFLLAASWRIQLQDNAWRWFNGWELTFMRSFLLAVLTASFVDLFSNYPEGQENNANHYRSKAHDHDLNIVEVLWILKAKLHHDAWERVETLLSIRNLWGPIHKGPHCRWPIQVETLKQGNHLEIVCDHSQ